MSWEEYLEELREKQQKQNAAAKSAAKDETPAVKGGVNIGEASSVSAFEIKA
jgi:hypothetical protein